MFHDAPYAWYFAYGSNLWIEQMIRRVGRGCLDRPPKVVRLPDYRLAFNMQGSCGAVFANIATPGAGVLGAIYYCDPAALAQLDKFEVGYDRILVQVLDRHGALLKAFAYVAQPECISNQGLPAAEYVRRIVLGARQHGLSEDYIRQIEALAVGSQGDHT